MKTFLATSSKFFIIGLIPVFLLLLGYIYLDPFMVLRSYKDYSAPYVVPNRDAISTEMFLRNNHRYHYNSFIFGSSRTLAYDPVAWKKHLAQGSNPFCFDASEESIYGIYTKLKYLDSAKCEIKNALIIIDRDVTFKNTGDSEGFLYMKDPIITGGSKLAFQITFFKGYLTPMFLLSYYGYLIRGHHYNNYMDGYIFNKTILFDTIDNRQRMLTQDLNIAQDSVGYYKAKKDIFYTRQGQTTDTVQRITVKCLTELTAIKNILERNKTRYRIILSPLYEQVKFNGKDLQILRNLFGNNVFDFSGETKFSESVSNFYENMHYRPMVGNQIMDIVYKTAPNVH